MHEVRKQKLGAFVEWVNQHITGDEKGEAQVFLDRLLQAFGQKGAKEAGGRYEERVKNDAGGTSFADYVWKPVVLIEMKKRGADLSKHYRQAFDYWTRLVPNRPRYVVLCNFDEFRVYDFDKQIDSPLDTVALEDLPGRWGPLAFLFPTNDKPTFGNDREAVTRDAADQLAHCFRMLRKRGVDEDTARRFILQMLVSMFSEDIGLLPKYLVVNLLDECKSPADSFDLLGGLFAAMNERKSATGGRYKGVAYFNGGLFAVPARIELQASEVEELKTAAAKNWAQVSPEIFGTIFQHSLEGDDRRAQGAHFTTPADIMKIVKPTIVEPWSAAIEGADTLTRLQDLQHRMTNYTVLDPACGSGNFLYIAYRELKQLEARLLERMTTEFPSQKGLIQQPQFSYVRSKQFFGLDINPFAIELAKVTMMIAKKLAIDELHISENALPLDNLDSNFMAQDALLDELENPRPWPKVDVIIGNPPFVGAKLLKPWRGPQYVNALRKAYPEVPGMSDYCVYWIRRSHDHLPPCTAADPLTGRAGLVGTQNIRNGQSRVGGLDYVAESGTIIEAVDNQPWSGEANVHVSIANWIKSRDAKLLPRRRRLWYKLDGAIKKKRKRGDGNAAKEFELGYRDADFINAGLSDKANVSEAKPLSCNEEPKRVFQGITPGHSGFVLDDSERNALVKKDAASAKVIFPYLIGRELLTGDGTPERWVIDFEQRPITQAQSFAAAFAHVKHTVLPDVEKKAKEEKAGETARKLHLQRWWMHWRSRPDRLAATKALKRRFIVCSRVTKRPIFVFVDDSIRPGDALQTFAFDDDYSFGVLQSEVHWRWFVATCSKLKSDFRYTPDTVFDTFPWPQMPTKRDVRAVADTARDVRRVRAEALASTRGGLRVVYRTMELPGHNPLKDAHAALDAAVLRAYGFSPTKDSLAQLLKLNHDVAARIAAGETPTAPGVPPSFGDRAPLVSGDRVQP